LRPYGWALWEKHHRAARQAFQGDRPRERGLPLANTAQLHRKGKSHVAGFSPELAVVTHGGGEELEEPLVIRPTSETIIGHSYAKWIQSYRDLPVLNQSMEQRGALGNAHAASSCVLLNFFWQEGHTAHATAEEADFETRQMLDVYTDFCRARSGLFR